MFTNLHFLVDPILQLSSILQIKGFMGKERAVMAFNGILETNLPYWHDMHLGRRFHCSGLSPFRNPYQSCVKVDEESKYSL